MSMLFRYNLVPMHRSIAPLGGRTVRPRPLVPAISIIGPHGTIAREALLDTGSDDTLFPDRLGALVGVDLTSVPAGQVTNPIAGSILVKYASVLLRLTDGREQREWPAIVGFTTSRLIYPLLGFAGCLQFFTSTFHGDREEVELAVNGLYPGT
jgi:hypothetical protein